MAGCVYHIGIRKYRTKARLKNLRTTWVQQPNMQLEESGKRPGLEDLKLDVFSRRWSWVHHKRKGPVVLRPCLVVFLVSASPSSFLFKNNFYSLFILGSSGSSLLRGLVSSFGKRHSLLGVQGLLTVAASFVKEQGL